MNLNETRSDKFAELQGSTIHWVHLGEGKPGDLRAAPQLSEVKDPIWLDFNFAKGNDAV
jgi:hypothetical protein